MWGKASQGRQAGAGRVMAKPSGVSARPGSVLGGEAVPRVRSWWRSGQGEMQGGVGGMMRKSTSWLVLGELVFNQGRGIFVSRRWGPSGFQWGALVSGMVLVEVWWADWRCRGLCLQMRRWRPAVGSLEALRAPLLMLSWEQLQTAHHFGLAEGFTCQVPSLTPCNHQRFPCSRCGILPTAQKRRTTCQTHVGLYPRVTLKPAS